MPENSPKNKSNILDVRIKNYGECGFCGEQDNRECLNIPWDIWSQWLYISRLQQDKEWGAVFWVKDSTVTGFKIPRQEVSSIDCEFKEELGGDGIIHSHHHMDAFHSSQDDTHGRNLYTYSIVITNSKGSIATKRVKLPCGGFGYVKITLQLSDLPQIELSKISQKRTDLFQEASYVSSEGSHPCDTCSTADCENCQLLDMPYLACENCTTYKCRSCKLTAGLDTRAVLPFCETCNDSNICSSCPRLEKYLKNYPDERGRLQPPA